MANCAGLIYSISFEIHFLHSFTALLSPPVIGDQCSFEACLSAEVCSSFCKGQEHYRKWSLLQC